MMVWNIYIYNKMEYTFLLRFSREERCHAAMSREGKKEMKEK